MKLFQTAWRNMWRNRGRTLLSSTAIFFSSLVVCLVVALENGFIGDMKTNVITNLTGDIRIMNGEYVKNERVLPLQYYIDGTAEVLSEVSKDPSVALATPRTDFAVSIYHDGEQIPSRAIGIDFATAPLLKSVNTRILAGSIPERGSDPGAGSSRVLVSEGLSKELGLVPGSKFTAISRTAISGSNGKTFTVGGIVSLADTDFANRVFFLDWHTAGEFLRMNGNALQIQVLLKETGNEKRDAASIAKTLGPAANGLDISPWYSVNTLYEFFTIANLMYLIIGSIFYLLASTVIFNTTMMSVLERKTEIGTLMALGMEKGKLLRLFLLESGLIAAIGAFAGTFVGFLVVSAVSRVGFDSEALWGNSIKGMSVSRILYPSLEWSQYLIFFCTGVAISLAACYFPARMVTRVQPADALADR